MLETLNRKAPTQREAQMALDALARCRMLRPEGQDENTVICTHDGFRIEWERGHYVHSSDQIHEYRLIASDGQWPA
ncbi:MAG TPA: hypothetical protein VMH41_16945 [Mycobacteriales bacterium]|nr:hypothetical protein [Mycobacteriales bacterium]